MTDAPSTDLLAGFSEPQPYTLDAADAAPADPGVHVVLDGSVVIYVGSTGNLRRRLRQHLRGNRGSSVLHEQVGAVLDAQGGLALASDIADWLGRHQISWRVLKDPESLKFNLVATLKPRFNRRIPKPRAGN